MTLTVPRLLMFVGAVCFAVATLIAATAIGGDWEAWLAAGLTFLTCGLILGPDRGQP